MTRSQWMILLMKPAAARTIFHGFFKNTKESAHYNIFYAKRSTVPKISWYILIILTVRLQHILVFLHKVILASSSKNLQVIHCWNIVVILCGKILKKCKSKSPFIIMYPDYGFIIINGLFFFVIFCLFWLFVFVIYLSGFCIYWVVFCWFGVVV